jgi:acyl carrier protein
MQERDAMSVLDHIREKAAIAFGIDLRKVTAESSWNDLNADPVGIVSFFVEVEEDYGLSMDSCVANDLATVGQLAAFVEANKTREPA